MRTERESPKAEVEAMIAETGMQVKTRLLEYCKERLPFLPKYDQMVNGFQDALEKKGYHTQGLRSGIKITSSYGSASSRGMIVLEEHAMVEVPFRFEGSEMKPDWENVREVAAEDYVHYSMLALEDIDFWASRLPEQLLKV